MLNLQRIATAKHAVIDAIASLDQFIDIDDSNLHIVGSTYIKDKQTSDVDVLVGVPSVGGCCGAVCKRAQEDCRKSFHSSDKVEFSMEQI